MPKMAVPMLALYGGSTVFLYCLYKGTIQCYLTGRMDNRAFAIFAVAVAA